MLFRIIYILFLFCASVLSLQTYGLPLTMRQLATIVMFVTCLITDKKIWIDKFFGIYLVFFFCFGFSSLITGHFDLYILRLVGDYFVAYVALWAVKILVMKYDGLYVLSYTLICLGLFDGAVTFCQFIGWDYLNPIVNRLGWLSYDRYADFQGEAMLLRSAPGIFSHPTLNAHVLIPCTLISLLAIQKNKILGVSISILMIVFLFSTQQRTAFIITILSIIFIFVYYVRKSKHAFWLLPLLGILLAIGVYKLLQFIMLGDFRFTELGLDPTGREDIYGKASSFIKNNPFGGLYDYIGNNEAYPHNLIYSSFIFGGWIGGLFLILVVIIQVKECMKILKGKPSFIEMVLMLSVISMIVNGLTHNQSIVNGEIMTWTVWGAFYYTKKKEQASQRRLKLQQSIPAVA